MEACSPEEMDAMKSTKKVSSRGGKSRKGKGKKKGRAKRAVK